MQHEPSKPFMNDHIKKAAERLLTGHYAPQDVIDVCRAALREKPNEARLPHGLALALSGGAVVKQSLRGIGNRALVTVEVHGGVDGWNESVDFTLHAGAGTKAGSIINLAREVDIYVAPHRSFQPEANAPAWISVKDRLPENGQRVLARYEGVYDHRVVEFWYNDPEHYHFGSPHEPDGRGSQPATHWYPLPPLS